MKRDWRRFWLRLSAFGDRPRGDFLEALAGLVDAGIPVYDAIREMAKVMRRERDARAAILADVARRLEQGQHLSEALRPWLASHEAMLVAANARGVELATALRNAGRLTEARRRIVGAITGAMAYPAALLAAGTGLLVVFGTQVIPILGTLIPAERWTGLGAFYHGLSALTLDYGVAILIAVLALSGAALGSMPRWRGGRVRRWLDRRLPPWNLYQVYQGAILLISISIMMRSGIPMADAVRILWDYSPSAWLRAHLAGIRRKLESGGGVRLAALDSPVFPADIRISVALFDRFSDPDQAMAALGIQAGESAEKSAKRIGAAGFAIVLVVVGGVVGGVVPAVMSVAMNFYSAATGSR